MNKPVNRREVLAGIGASLVLPGCGKPAFDPSMLVRYEYDFAYPLYASPGEHALAAWEVLSKRLGTSASAVVLGSRADLEFLADAGSTIAQDSQALLEQAESRDFPAGFREFRKREFDRTIADMRSDPRWQDVADEMASDYRSSEAMPIGDWPDAGSQGFDDIGLSIAADVMTGRPLDEVILAEIPNADWTAIPAYLKFGGWNECPAPPWHVAALRYWRDQHGARLIGMSSDVINMRVQRRPQTREAALTLAREQFDYCEDIVLQGTGDIAALAAHLMQTDWWYFWWD